MVIYSSTMFKFLSTPPLRRATLFCAVGVVVAQFLSTPPLRRATEIRQETGKAAHKFLSTPPLRRATKIF